MFHNFVLLFAQNSIDFLENQILGKWIDIVVSAEFEETLSSASSCATKIDLKTDHKDNASVDFIQTLQTTTCRVFLMRC